MVERSLDMMVQKGPVKVREGRAFARLALLTLPAGGFILHDYGSGHRNCFRRASGRRWTGWSGAGQYRHGLSAGEHAGLHRPTWLAAPFAFARDRARVAEFVARVELNPACVATQRRVHG